MGFFPSADLFRWGCADVVIHKPCRLKRLDLFRKIVFLANAPETGGVISEIRTAKQIFSLHACFALQICVGQPRNRKKALGLNSTTWNFITGEIISCSNNVFMHTGYSRYDGGLQIQKCEPNLSIQEFV
jgi:hypothetical protein